MANLISIDFNAFSVNVSANPHVIGLPTMNAIDGYAHNIEREFGIELKGWSIAYRRCEVLDGHPKIVRYELDQRPEKDKSTIANILDRRLAQVEGVLILNVKDRPDSEVLMTMNERIEALRFSGGSIILGKTNVQIWRDYKACFQEISRSYMEPHFLVEDKSELLLNPPEGLTKLDWLMDLVARPKTYEEKETVYAYGTDYLGYLTPIIKGYKLLESPRKRDYVRGGYDHAYAEPIIGVGRMRSMVSVMHGLNDKTADSEAINVRWIGQMDSEFESDEFELVAESII